MEKTGRKPNIYSLAVLTAITLLILVILAVRGRESGLRWANVVLTGYFGGSVACLLAAFRKQLRYNMYSYNTILYMGFALFLLSLFGTFLTMSVKSFAFPDGFHAQEMLFTLVHSAKNYMFLTLPLLAAFSVALLVSNLALIRHEGRRFVNILGILLAICLLAGEALIAYLDFNSAYSAKGVLARNLVVNLMAAFYLYFECMIIGAAIADLIAARYVPEKDRDFLIVLGCGLKKDGSPTPLLKGRLDRALDFYQKQKAQTGKELTFIASGGQGPDEAISESAAMKRYLTERGVPASRIVEEDQSTDTFENMKFSKEKILQIDPDGKIAFATTNYHVFRSGLFARRVKMRAAGMGARTKWYFWPNAAVREFVGLLTAHRGKQALIIGGLILSYVILTLLSYR